MSGRKNLFDEMGKTPTARRGGRTMDLLDFDSMDDRFYGPGSSAGSYKGSSAMTPVTPRCYESHPPLKLPGTELVIYGGSCSYPVVQDADVYVGLCTSMKHTARSWPWKQGTEFLFSITDMCAPSNPEEFKKMLNWVKKQVDEGKKVHVGCIGGHGRTGTVLAALVSLYGEQDAIQYVRKHYCHKAVESGVQIAFLHTHFGTSKVEPSKGSSWSASSKTPSKQKLSQQASSTGPKAETVIHPLIGAGSIWG